MANTGDDDVVMVFGFPHPDYPPDGTGLMADGRLGTAAAALPSTCRACAGRSADACRVLATEGYTDLTLGHVSARVPGRDAILVKRKGLALEEVRPEDVVMVDLDARPIEDGEADLHLETALHTEVYRARPDVGAVVHGHPPYATALAATGARLEMLTHDAVLFADGLPRYESSPDLVTSVGRGRRRGARPRAAAGRC